MLGTNVSDFCRRVKAICWSETSCKWRRAVFYNIIPANILHADINVNRRFSQKFTGAASAGYNNLPIMANPVFPFVLAGVT